MLTGNELSWVMMILNLPNFRCRYTIKVLVVDNTSMDLA